MFECDKCGECCRNLDKSEVYKDLDSGDGTCKYLKDNLCSIYDERPLLCRVDESYHKFFSDSYKIEEYYEINKKICEELKMQKL